MIKILLGGSPCTYWSIAQKNNRETEPSGLGWELFLNYCIAKEKFKPDIFLYENNKSAAQAIKDEIKQRLCIGGGTTRYIEINSALVSAQNRKRFYVHNCGDVQQPKDRGIVLKDILESGGNLTSFNSQSGKMSQAAEPIKLGKIGKGWQGNRLYSAYEKAISQTAQGGGLGSHTGLYAVPYENVGEVETIQKVLPKLIEKYGYIPEKFNAYNVAEITEKTPTLSTGSMVTSSCATNMFVRTDKPIYEVKGGFITIKDKQYPIRLPDGYYIIRKLTVTECCRLQTLPDDYCRAVSNSQAYKGLGNGWTAEVIIHILQNALKDIPKDEEIIVLSMYDGIGTGRYCLDKMGFTNIKYYAYEIDKYAIQIAMSNYPDIIQCGDAFAVRENDWGVDIQSDIDELIYDKAELLAENALCKKQCLCPDWKKAGECCSCDVFLGLRDYYTEKIKNNGVVKNEN